MSSYLVGRVRPSQLLWTYGPGALIDLPNLSVITMGLNRWNIDRCPPVEEARPAPFPLACRNGHLDDFPWHWFVHGGSSVCKGTLRFFERGASLQTENLWVKCDSCDAARSLVHAFGREAQENLPACRGRHPHLDKYEEG